MNFKVNIDTSKMAEREPERIQDPSANQKEATVVAEPNESEAGEERKITDLNADCLEHIFKQLELTDLMNVADTRKSFREGVKQAFTSKYGKRDVLFYFSKGRSNLKINESGKGIIVKEFATGLKFLRCFGEFTSTLKISQLHRSHRLEFDRYLNEYCTETLKDLTFFYAPKGAIAGLKQPFTNVEKLYVHCGVLGKKLSDFNRWFPNLQHLELFRIRVHTVTDRKCIEVVLPHLKCLEIDDANAVFQSENVANCFRLNPQLQTLRICNALNLPSVLKSASELPHLEELHIQSYGNALVNMQEVIHFKNVKKFGLVYFDPLPLSQRPLTFEQLEEFSVERLPPSDGIQKFISMHPSVKKITFINIHITEDLKENLKEKWSFGDKWRASFKFEERRHNMEIERNN